MERHAKVISILLNVAFILIIAFLTITSNQSENKYQNDLNATIYVKEQEITRLKAKIEESHNLVDEYSSNIVDLEKAQDKLKRELDKAIEDQRKYDDRLSYDYNYAMADLTVGWLYKIITDIRDNDYSEVSGKLSNFIIPNEVTIGKDYNGLKVQDIKLYRTPHNEGDPEAGNLYDGERIEFIGEFTVSGNIIFDDVEYGAFRVFTSDLNVVPHRVHHRFEGLPITIVDSLQPYEVENSNMIIEKSGIKNNEMVTVTLRNLVLDYQYGKPITNTAEFVSIKLSEEGQD